MAKRVTRQVREECFRALGELCHEGSKVILTGRPGFSPDNTQLTSAAQLISNRDFLTRTTTRRQRATNSVIISTIEPLSEEAPMQALWTCVQSRSLNLQALTLELLGWTAVLLMALLFISAALPRRETQSPESDDPSSRRP